MKKIKIAAKEVKEIPEDPFFLKGSKALLLSEGCKLDAAKKEIEKRLKEIKEELNLEQEGQYTNSEGDRISISYTKNYSEPDPKEIYSLMKTKKLGKFFWKCVKLSITELKKYISENEVNSFRKELDPIKRHSFK
jgi:hypothetical protein